MGWPWPQPLVTVVPELPPLCLSCLSSWITGLSCQNCQSRTFQSHLAFAAMKKRLSTGSKLCTVDFYALTPEFHISFPSTNKQGTFHVSPPYYSVSVPISNQMSLISSTHDSLVLWSCLELSSHSILRMPKPEAWFYLCSYFHVIYWVYHHGFVICLG